MAWDFETDREYQKQLDWADTFVRQEIEPLDLVLDNPYDKSDARAMALAQPLKDEVKAHGLWACHLGPELGGPGYGQVKLALLNETLGRSKWAPSIFGCQAPDSGNAEILAHYGTVEQKAAYLQPLLDGDIGSCFVMTEPHAGADPTLFTTTATRADTDWVINGEKWFASEAAFASFFIVMAVTDPDASAHHGMSMFIVDPTTPGVEIVRNVGTGTRDGHHAYLRFTDVRIPADAMLGGQGQAFAVAQTRLGGGRVHHAMRTIALVRKAFDLLCERAVSRETKNGTLGTLQMTQERIADSWVEMEQFRLLVLRTAWLIDKHQDYRAVRKDISAIKAAMPKVLHDVAQRAMHLHGSLGISNEMPFSDMMVESEIMAIADGPTEVHKIMVAREILKHYSPTPGLWPTGHLPTRRVAAEAHIARRIELVVGNQ
ncbi:acyl-CoA dehydrogenase family protein [Nocardia salmonicida]|uniref:acyl-CoA dehydrogenase family protein n=1 Tax=Nocardia salmonicida TaxID=53431 RepID=UPI002E28E0C6|nr:acyl-CoA dehydrogenase family protein [Nocardia salmonicida]